MRVTVPGLRELVAVEFGLAITDVFAAKLLTEFGYHSTEEIEPSLTSDGGLGSVQVWVRDERARPLSRLEKLEALSSRLELLSQAFVDDLMDDELLHFASLDDVAIEATRAFSTALSDAVKARARFGAQSLLPRCGETALLAFKSSLKR